MSTIAKLTTIWNFFKVSGDRKSVIVLTLLLAAFCCLQLTLPLGSAIKIGADEDFALSKAMLTLDGYKMYVDYWNDQPPLHTFLLKSIFQYISYSVLAARLLTIGSTLLLLSALFLLVRRISGLFSAAVAIVLLVASPGFVELSASSMVELSGLAPAVASLCLLYMLPAKKWMGREILAALIFAIALQIKLIEALYLPLVALILWFQHRKTPSTIKSLIGRCICFGLTTGIAFVAINYATGNSLVTQYEQSRASHFSAAKAYEYGSPNDHPFDWTVLLKNWETVVPAVWGVVLFTGQIRKNIVFLLPVCWLGLTFLIFSVHKPWWPYYYVHMAIPLCWCAGRGIQSAWQIARSSRSLLGYGTVCMYILCAVSWFTGRIYLQTKDIRNAPRTYSSPVLNEIQRYKPFTKFIFANEPVYAFYADIPIPPKLATLSLKRFWTGDTSNAQVSDRMRQIKPGIILLANDTKPVPFQELIFEEYQLVYQDSRHRLYVTRNIAKEAPF